MREWAEYKLDESDGGSTVSISGPLLISTIGVLDRELREFEGSVQRIDLSGATEIDTVGAWVVRRFSKEQDAEISGASDQASDLLAKVEESESTADIKPQRPRTLERVPEEIGERVIEFGHGVVRVVGFLGAVVAGFGTLLRHPSRFRGKALVRQLELVGVSSLGIIGLMSFLIGIVIAQQGAAQLRQFGAEIYTINLTGRLTLRELGVLMTAIMVAGRSGSAFAAQIGTMRLTEEVDAMRTIGVSPMEALILPRILAAVLMMPLLGFYASVVAIIGGAFVSELTLDIPFLTFLSRIQDVVPIYDLWVGLIKAPVFGLIVALSGCYQGMQVKGNAEEVGLRTTQAVVMAIFMVIVLDAFFAVFFSELGWA
ncbi:ABC transporter permease [Altericroceibacterium endophyticum]|uniref:MlaE family lipid ABC transporter permease subunit n=1 Tax=Altericroceibacterium endophyticum TaxID=1808508 RepID=A0A6I4T913_9SPHN|nr:ABC transporter permease [Altericroceibacterium endophyticum]MXO66533.1 MlaE family lipid ABC transporter permease subunit [Altericroceibacterium endophyticum]